MSHFSHSVGVTIVEQVPTGVYVSAANRRYLAGEGAPGPAHARAPARAQVALRRRSLGGIRRGDSAVQGTMAIRSESRVAIAGTVPEVWAYVCDVGRWQEWAPTVRDCWVAKGGPLQPGSRLEQRAKGPFGSTRYRAQEVTAVEAPRRLAFAGPMGTSAARWGMELRPIDDRQTDAMMWVEVDLKSIMRAIPGGVLNRRIQRVMDIEMAAIKAAVESATPDGSDSAP